MIKNDGWANVLTGLSGKMDKKQFNDFVKGKYLSEDLLSDLYINNGLAKKIIDIIPDDMTRQWISIEDDKDDKIKKKLEFLQAETIFKNALSYQRLFGGSIIIMGIADGRDPSEPVNVNNIKDVFWLYPIEKTEIELSLSKFNTDILSENYGKVELYKVQIEEFTENGATTERLIDIHSSRVLEFKGELLPRCYSNYNIEDRYWGISSLQSMWDSLSDLGIAYHNVSNLIQELIINVYKFPQLAEKLAQKDGEKAVINRMEIINMYKSIINGVILDSEEDISRTTANLGNLAEILDRLMMSVSADSGIPLTRLFGRSPAGQNATGESDERIYYDKVKSDQETDMRPALNKLIKYIALSKTINVKDNVQFIFNPLFQMTEKEQAELNDKQADSELKKAQERQIYMMNGVLSGEEVRDLVLAEKFIDM
jgi:phage-related protein (TIGR01555 family)